MKEFDGHVIPRTEHTEVVYKPIREVILAAADRVLISLKVSFNPSDTKFCTASDDGDVKIWDFATCQEERVLQGTPPPFCWPLTWCAGLGTEVKAAAWHPQGALIASGSRDNKAILPIQRTPCELIV